MVFTIIRNYYTYPFLCIFVFFLCCCCCYPFLIKCRLSWVRNFAFPVHHCVSNTKILLLFFSFFHFWPPHSIWSSWARHQIQDLSCSCNLCHSCGNARSLTHCSRPGITPVTQPSQDATDSIAPWQELYQNYSQLMINLDSC